MRTLLLLVVLVLLGGGAYMWLQGGTSVPVPTGAATDSGASAGVVAVGSSNVESKHADAPSTSVDETQREHVVAKNGMAGRLVQGGTPLVDVTVMACQGSPNKAKLLHRVVTDAAGEFRIPEVAGRFWLTADGESVAHYWRSRWMEPEGGIGDVVVVKPGSISGVVRDEAGGVIAGAKVKRALAIYHLLRFESGPPTEELSCTTDEHGRFYFDRVAKNQGRLRCRAVGFQMEPQHDVELDVGEDVTTEIVLRPGMTLRGLVMDHVGHPLPGAKVTTADVQETVTDALGQFAIEDFRRYAEINISAKGHLPHEIKWLFDARKPQRVKLERAVTLRGVVIGSNNQPGTVYAEYSDEQRADASKTACYGVLLEKFDIVRDGEFALPGFALADFDVTIHIPGVGVCGPMRVELRDDREVEFVIVPQRSVAVSIRNAEGQLIADAKLVRDDGISEYPQRYGVTDEALNKLVARSYKKRKPVDVADGTINLGVQKGEGVAFYVDAPGYLRATAAALSDALPERMDVVMARAGVVRGVVHGGMRDAYSTYVSITALDANGEEIVKKTPDQEGSVRLVVASGAVNRQGGFVIRGLAPGSYRAQISRGNTKLIGLETRGVPLIDGYNDAREATDFVVEAGGETNIELTEPPLGRLTGRVLLRGAPLAGAIIVASRPSKKAESADAQESSGSLWNRDNWDDEIQLKYASGQLSGKGGAFEFLYRDAGPVEVRVRHVDGLTTSNPFIINLPAPGGDVVRDFEIPAGEVRGRYPMDSLDESQRESFTVTMFPSNKVLHDPFYHGRHSGSLAWECPSVEKSVDGSFRFSYVRPGPWLVRVYTSGDVLLWQRTVDVRHDVVDVGNLPAVAPVQAKVKWSFAGTKPGKVLGVWLRIPQPNGKSPVWAGTFSSDKGLVTCTVLPGKYVVSAFGWRGLTGDEEDFFIGMGLGLTGEEFTKPVPIEIHADGSVTPEAVEFTATKAEGK